MTEDRADKFREEIEELQLKTSSTGADRALQIGGLVVMVVAVVMGFILWSASTTQEALDQNESIILAAAMVALAVLGAALYVVAATKQFLRVWLLRILYETRNDNN